MDDNPYKSPQADESRQPAADRKIAPEWRKVASLPLIIFGASYAFALPAAAIDGIENGFSGHRLILSALISAAGGGLLLGGLRLRRSAIVKKSTTSD